MKARSDIPGTVSVLQIAPMIRALEELGHDGNRVLGLAGVERAAIDDPHGRLPAAVELEVWDAAVAVSGDPQIGLRIAERLRIGSLGAYEYLLRNSATTRVALERANRFERVVDDLTRISLVEQDGVARMRLWREGGYPHPTEAVECLFLLLVQLCRTQTPDHPPLEVCFRHTPPSGADTYSPLFCCPVRFGRAHDEIAFPRAMLDAPVVSADPGLGAVLEEHVQRLLDALPNEDPFVHRARGALLRSVGQGRASLDSLAATLALSPRTLRRRLAEHGASYKTLLDDVRRDLALHHVGRGDVPLEQLRERLGFGDPSAFYRAFKRWTGVTPAQYRSAQRGAT